MPDNQKLCKEYADRVAPILSELEDTPDIFTKLRKSTISISDFQIQMPMTYQITYKLYTKNLSSKHNKSFLEFLSGRTRDAYLRKIRSFSNSKLLEAMNIVIAHDIPVQPSQAAMISPVYIHCDDSK